MDRLFYKSARELAQLVRSGRLSPVDLIEATLRRIESVNPVMNAFVTLRPEAALKEAAAMADAIAGGRDPGPLAGVPFGVKDLEDLQGMVTSFGSVPYRNNPALEDSVQVSRLRAAGAIPVGKTNTPEFGFTGFTKNRLYGTTRNPWCPDRTPGGSSGGSAAAVAAGMVPMATGSDAGGSIRIPACYSGCFGIKPTYGRIPTGPSTLLYMSRTWTPGPITRTVEDAALYLDCTAGYHPADPESLPPPGYSCLKQLEQLPPCLRIAFSPTLGYARVQKEVMHLAERAANSFAELGHRVERWKGGLPDAGRAWMDLFTTEIYARVHRDLQRIRPDMGKALARALDHASRLSINQQIRNQELRSQLNQGLMDLFSRFDLLLTPAMPTEAFSAKGPPPTEIDGHPVPLTGAVAFTFPFNLSGHPAATVRTGLTTAGLPAGLQIVGPRYRDDQVLQAARAYEQARPWNNRWPDI